MDHDIFFLGRSQEDTSYVDRNEGDSTTVTDTETDAPVPENQIGNSMFAMRIVLWLVGRFPFGLCQKKIVKNVSLDQHGSRVSTTSVSRVMYSKRAISFHWLYFACTSIFLTVTFVFLSLGFSKAYLDWDTKIGFRYPDFTSEEQEKFDENLVPFVLVWSCLLNTIVGSCSFIFKRQNYAEYFNDWEDLLVTLKLRLPWRLRFFLIGSNLWIAFFLGCVCYLSWQRVASIAYGGPELIFLLQLKIFLAEPLSSDCGLHLGGMVLLMYSMYSSRVFLFLFAFFCRLLTFCFRCWNIRLDQFIAKTANCNDVIDSDAKRNCDLLFKQHCILVKKVRKTNKLFGGILQSYYATQILNLCFELYYLARSSAFPGHDGGNIIAAVLLLVQNISVFITVSLDASRVQSAALKGLHLLKIRGRKPTDGIHYKYLMDNLYASFNERIVITGGGFFPIDKPFVLKVLGAVCTYFVIVLQFGDRIQPL